jgi:hypothetical protein
MLEAQICDVMGEPIAGGTIYRTGEGGGLEVTDPLNDSRTARLTLSLYDKAARHARPLDRVLAVTYGPYLIFKGPILQASTDYANGTVTINAHDATIRLKHHYHRYGDVACDSQYPVDGRGVRWLTESALPTATEMADDMPPNGILWGHDTTTHEPATDEGIWRGPVKPGTNVWESLGNLTQVFRPPLTEGGPPLGIDFRFRPVDKDHLGVYGATIPGFFCELDTADRLGADKHDTLILEHGQGTDNAENVMHEPDGDVVRNRATIVYPGGQKNRSDPERHATANATGSQHDYGLLEAYESSGQQKDTKTILKAKAKDIVQAYARPPDFFTVSPRMSHYPDVPTYPGDYKVGDTITARARKGNRQVELVGRIISATVAAVDQAGNSRVTLECVPDLDVTPT